MWHTGDLLKQLLANGRRMWLLELCTSTYKYLNWLFMPCLPVDWAVVSPCFLASTKKKKTSFLFTPNSIRRHKVFHWNKETNPYFATPGVPAVALIAFWFNTKLYWSLWECRRTYPEVIILTSYCLMFASSCSEEAVHLLFNHFIVSPYSFNICAFWSVARFMAL